MTRTAMNMPAGANLSKQISEAIQSWPGSDVHKKRPTCKHQLHLGDALAYVSGELGKAAGRRVLLAVTNGEDDGSKHTWPQVKAIATQYGVTVFGLHLGRLPSRSFVISDRGPENAFNSICSLTGGLIFTATEFDLQSRLMQFVDLLRNRYIVEFPRPNDPNPDSHIIDVKIAKFKGTIRISGNLVPVANAQEIRDTNSIQADPSPAQQPDAGKAASSPQ